MDGKRSTRQPLSRSGLSKVCRPPVSSSTRRATSSAQSMATTSPPSAVSYRWTWFEDDLKTHYELTVGPRLGPAEEDAKEATILNRVVRWTPEGLEYEEDPRQAEKLIHECGKEGSNSVATPGLKETAAQIAEDAPLEPRRDAGRHAPSESRRVERAASAGDAAAAERGRRRVNTGWCECDTIAVRRSALPVLSSGPSVASTRQTPSRVRPFDEP